MLPIDNFQLSSIFLIVQIVQNMCVYIYIYIYIYIYFFFYFQNNIKSGIYPAPLQSLWAIVAILAAIHFAKYGIVHKSINAILVLMPGYVFLRPSHL